jgi:hypothetical protein
MKIYLDASREQVRDDPFERIGSLIRESTRTWSSAGAVFGLAGGVSAPALGALLTVVNWFTSQQRASLYLSRLSTTLFILTIPLLALGAHCLDLLETRAAASAPSAGMLPAAATPVSASAHPALRGGGRYVHKGGVSAAALLVILALPVVSRAQQTIFNVPTTDVLERGKVYFELDASFKPSDSEAVARFSSFVPRVVVGAGHRVEVGLNVTGNVQPGADATTIVPTFKWKAYDGSDNGWAIVAGDHLFFPVRNRAYTAGNYVYAEVSKTFKNGTRLTAGGYDFTRNVVAAANRAGGQFGFEQPVNKKVTLAADYFTGRHAAGFFTPGVVFKIGKKVTGYAGYSVGNQNPSRGNNFFLLEFGYNFN